MRFLFFTILLSLVLDASHVRWFGDFETAHKEALREDKNLMLLVLKKGCSTCQEVLETTFINQSYIDEINKEFISVIVTKDQKSSYPIEMLYTLTYPALFFLDKNELFTCEPIVAKITPERLKNHLKQCK